MATPNILKFFPDDEVTRSVLSSTVIPEEKKIPRLINSLDPGTAITVFDNLLRAYPKSNLKELRKKNEDSFGVDDAVVPTLLEFAKTDIPEKGPGLLDRVVSRVGRAFSSDEPSPAAPAPAAPIPAPAPSPVRRPVTMGTFAAQAPGANPARQSAPAAPQSPSFPTAPSESTIGRNTPVQTYYLGPSAPSAPSAPMAVPPAPAEATFGDVVRTAPAAAVPAPSSPSLGNVAPASSTGRYTALPPKPEEASLVHTAELWQDSPRDIGVWEKTKETGKQIAGQLVQGMAMGVGAFQRGRQAAIDNQIKSLNATLKDPKTNAAGRFIAAYALEKAEKASKDADELAKAAASGEDFWREKTANLVNIPPEVQQAIAEDAEYVSGDGAVDRLLSNPLDYAGRLGNVIAPQAAMYAMTVIPGGLVFQQYAAADQQLEDALKLDSYNPEWMKKYSERRGNKPVILDQDIEDKYLIPASIFGGVVEQSSNLFQMKGIKTIPKGFKKKALAVFVKSITGGTTEGLENFSQNEAYGVAIVAAMKEQAERVQKSDPVGAEMLKNMAADQVRRFGDDRVKSFMIGFLTGAPISAVSAAIHRSDGGRSDAENAKMDKVASDAAAAAFQQPPPSPTPGAAPAPKKKGRKPRSKTAAPVAPVAEVALVPASEPAPTIPVVPREVPQANAPRPADLFQPEPISRPILVGEEHAIGTLPIGIAIDMAGRKVYVAGKAKDGTIRAFDPTGKTAADRKLSIAPDLKFTVTIAKDGSMTLPPAKPKSSQPAKAEAPASQAPVSPDVKPAESAPEAPKPSDEVTRIAEEAAKKALSEATGKAERVAETESERLDREAEAPDMDQKGVLRGTPKTETPPPETQKTEPASMETATEEIDRIAQEAADNALREATTPAPVPATRTQSGAPVAPIEGAGKPREIPEHAVAWNRASDAPMNDPVYYGPNNDVGVITGKKGGKVQISDLNTKQIVEIEGNERVHTLPIARGQVEVETHSNVRILPKDLKIGDEGVMEDGSRWVHTGSRDAAGNPQIEVGGKSISTDPSYDLKVVARPLENWDTGTNVVRRSEARVLEENQARNLRILKVVRDTNPKTGKVGPAYTIDPITGQKFFQTRNVGGKPVLFWPATVKKIKPSNKVTVKTDKGKVVNPRVTGETPPAQPESTEVESTPATEGKSETPAQAPKAKVGRRRPPSMTPLTDWSRGRGGIHPDALEKSGLSGEFPKGLKGKGGLLNRRRGNSLTRLAEDAHDLGMIDEPSEQAYLAALSDEQGSRPIPHGTIEQMDAINEWKMLKEEKAREEEAKAMEAEEARASAAIAAARAAIPEEFLEFTEVIHDPNLRSIPEGMEKLEGGSLIEGYHDPNLDVSFINVANITPARARELSFHETAERGHVSLSRDLPNNEGLRTALNRADAQLMKALPDLLKKTNHKDLADLTSDYKIDLSTPEGKMDLQLELLARWSERFANRPKEAWYNAIIDQIRDVIRKFAGAKMDEKAVDKLAATMVKYGTLDLGRRVEVNRAKAVESQRQGPADIAKKAAAETISKIEEEKKPDEKQFFSKRKPIEQKVEDELRGRPGESIADRAAREALASIIDEGPGEMPVEVVAEPTVEQTPRQIIESKVEEMRHPFTAFPDETVVIRDTDGRPFMVVDRSMASARAGRKKGYSAVAVEETRPVGKGTEQFEVRERDMPLSEKGRLFATKKEAEDFVGRSTTKTIVIRGGQDITEPTGRWTVKRGNGETVSMDFTSKEAADAFIEKNYPTDIGTVATSTKYKDLVDMMTLESIRPDTRGMSSAQRVAMAAAFKQQAKSQKYVSNADWNKRLIKQAEVEAKQKDYNDITGTHGRSIETFKDRSEVVYLPSGEKYTVYDPPMMTEFASGESRNLAEAGEERILLAGAHLGREGELTGDVHYPPREASLFVSPQVWEAMGGDRRQRVLDAGKRLYGGDNGAINSTQRVTIRLGDGTILKESFPSRAEAESFVEENYPKDKGVGYRSGTDLKFMASGKTESEWIVSKLADRMEERSQEAPEVVERPAAETETAAKETLTPEEQKESELADVAMQNRYYKKAATKAERVERDKVRAVADKMSSTMDGILSRDPQAKMVIHLPRRIMLEYAGRFENADGLMRDHFNIPGDGKLETVINARRFAPATAEAAFNSKVTEKYQIGKVVEEDALYGVMNEMKPGSEVMYDGVPMRIVKPMENGSVIAMNREGERVALPGEAQVEVISDARGLVPSAQVLQDAADMTRMAAWEAETQNLPATTEASKPPVNVTPKIAVKKLSSMASFLEKSYEAIGRRDLADAVGMAEETVKDYFSGTMVSRWEFPVSAEEAKSAANLIIERMNEYKMEQEAGTPIGKARRLYYSKRKPTTPIMPTDPNYGPVRAGLIELAKRMKRGFNYVMEKFPEFGDDPGVVSAILKNSAKMVSGLGESVKNSADLMRLRMQKKKWNLGTEELVTRDGEKPSQDVLNYENSLRRKREAEDEAVKKSRFAIMRDFVGKELVDAAHPLKVMGDSREGRKALMRYWESKGAIPLAREIAVEAEKIIQSLIPPRLTEVFENLRAATRVIEVEKVWGEKKIKESYEVLKKELKDKAPTFEQYRTDTIEDLKYGMAPAVVDGKEIKMTTKQAQSYVDFLKKTEYWGDLQKAMDVLDEVARDNLFELRKNGMISQDSFEYMLENHKNYTLRMFVEFIDPYTGSDVQERGLYGKKISVSESGLKRLMGGSRTKTLVLDWKYLLNQTVSRRVNRVMKQRANIGLSEYVKAAEASGNNPLDMHIIEPIEGKKGSWDLPPPANPDAVTRVYYLAEGEDGEVKKYAIEMPSELSNAWQTYDQRANSLFLQGLSALSGTPLFKPIATGLNPIWALRNIPRDIAFALLKNPYMYGRDRGIVANATIDFPRTAANFVMGIADAIANGKDTKEYNGYGWGTSSSLAYDFQYHPEGGRMSGGKASRAWEAFNHYAGAPGRVTETGGRVAIFRAFRKSMKSDAEKELGRKLTAEESIENSEYASYAAAMTMNFSRKGGLSADISRVSPYFNVGVQAMDGLVESFKTDKKRFIAKMTSIAVMGYMAEALRASVMSGWGDDYEKEYDPEQMKNFIIIPFGPSYIDSKTGEVVRNSFKIPAEQAARVPLAVGAQVFRAQNGDGFDWKPIKQAISDNASASMPPTMAAAIALWGNYDIFSGREIYPQKFAPVNARSEKFPSTTGRAELIAGILDFLPIGEGPGSPARVDVAMKKLFPSNTYLEGLLWAPSEAILSKMSNENLQKLNTTLQERSKEMIMNNSLVKSWFVQSRVKPQMPEAVATKNEAIRIPETYMRSTLDESNPLRPLQKRIQDATGGQEMPYTQREFKDKILQGEKDYNSIVADIEYRFDSEVMPQVMEYPSSAGRGPTPREIENSPGYLKLVADMDEQVQNMPEGVRERVWGYLNRKLAKAGAEKGAGDQDPSTTEAYRAYQEELKAGQERSGAEPGYAPKVFRP